MENAKIGFLGAIIGGIVSASYVTYNLLKPPDWVVDTLKRIAVKTPGDTSIQIWYRAKWSDEYGEIAVCTAEEYKGYYNPLLLLKSREHPEEILIILISLYNVRLFIDGVEQPVWGTVNFYLTGMKR